MIQSGHAMIGVLVVLASAVTSARSQDFEDVNQLVDGLVSRASELHCAKLDFTYKIEATQDGTTIRHRQIDLGMTVDGHDWIVRQSSQQAFRMKRNDASVTYYETNTHKGQEMQRSLHIEAPQTLQDLIGQNACFAAAMLGSFWFPAQAQFVDRHRDTVTLNRTRLIDGIQSFELEWPVTATDFDEAFIVIPNAIGRARRGRLRVCTAPSLGFALPCIEYVAPDGKVAQSFICHDFNEFGSGFFLPKRAECKTQLDGGVQRSEFSVHQISHVNSPLPKDEFTLRVPKGTRVRDSRPGMPASVFYLEEQDQFDSLNRVLAPRTERQLPSGRIMLLTVNFVILVILLICFIVYQCTHTSASRS